MRVTRAQLDDKDYFEKKLEMECYEGELIIQILERETLKKLPLTFFLQIEKISFYL